MRKETPEYFEARRWLNRHFYHHHEDARGFGTLADRLTQHEEMHLFCKRHGIELGHTHKPYPEGETDIEAARRMYDEGEFHGQKDPAVGAGKAAPVDRRQAKRRR